MEESNTQLNIELKKRVMRRVRTVWLARKLTSPTALKAYIAAVLLWQTASRVSLGNIIKNAPSLADFGAFYTFTITAFAHTQGLIQVFTIITIAIALWLARDIISIRPHKLVR